MIEGWTACFVGLNELRTTSRYNHQLIDILMIAVCAMLACAKGWEDIIELYGRSKQVWLEIFLALPNSIPSHDTEPAPAGWTPS